MTNIRLRAICKTYGVVEVIHGVDLEIGSGEFVALVGPSGCGKSTLLRMIAGLEGITGGDLQIGGRRMNEVPPKDRDIAMVFQSYALYPHMNVADNMGFSLRLRRVGKAEKARAVGEAARILGLEPLLDRFPRELSGGQRQRVAMGRAIVRDLRVFLFDEPLSNLDAKLRVNTRAEIKALHQRLRTTTVYVTLDQIEAMTMADCIIVMHGGRVEQAGSPLDLYDNPANLFVAGFLGSPAMNFIEGEHDPGAGLFRVRGGPEVALPGVAWAHQGRAILGLRPEHFRLGPLGVPGRLELLEPTGAETQLLLRWGAQAVTATLRERLHGTAGDTVTLAFNPDRAHLFDPENGRVIPRAAGGHGAMARDSNQAS